MNTLFLLLFGIVLVGLVVYFLKYKSTFEAFQVGSVPVVESDKFLNNTLDPLTPTFTSVSTLYGIKEDFKAYVTDWHNFAGNTERSNGYPPYQYAPSFNITYNDYYGNIKQETIPTNDIIITTSLDNGSSLAPLTYVYNFLYYFNGQIGRNVGTFQNSLSIPTDQYYERSCYASEINDPSKSCKPLDSNTFIDNFNKFITTIQKNRSILLRKFLQGFQLWNTISFNNKISPSIYLASEYYKAPINSDATNWWATGITVHSVGNRTKYIAYDIGRFAGANYTPPQSITTANSEQLKLYVYGSFCNYHSNDFRECLHWGSAFDFKENTLLDMYLNVPYYDKYLNGSNVFYSYGHFFPEVTAKSSAEPFTFVPNNVCISNNAYLVNLRNDSSIRTPSSFEPNVTYDNDGNITSIRYGANQTISQIPTTSNLLSNTTLQEQFVGKISPQVLAKMPIMMRRFIISWAYNRTLRTLDSCLDNTHWDNDPISYNINKGALLITLAYNNWSNYSSIGDSANTLIWSNYLTKYFYTGLTMNKTDNTGLAGYNMGSINGRKISNSMNPEINALATVVLFGNPKAKGLTFRKSDSHYWGQRWDGADPAFTTNTDGIFYSLNIGNNPNLSYQTSGNTWDLTSDTIQNMIGDFKVNIAKIVPDYGIANTINVLDQKMLDSIAQSFYEYSDGLFEMNFIYDVYPIGSNMMDIRFDKKQRLGPLSYISLRNTYQPKIIEYNNLVNLYEQNTWQDTYSNVNDLLSNISTIKSRDLDSVFNPVYTIGNRNPDTIRNDINRITQSNITLSNQLLIASGPITTVLNNSNYASLNSNAPVNSNVSDYFNTLLTKANSPIIDIANIQQQIDSNDTQINNLSNQLDGIETNVARIFFTMNSSSNLTVNGVALGPNAALSYNPIYNAGLQADMGQSQGNVNYQPTILYTKNVTPIIDPYNIEFMKKASQLYMDAVPNSLSSFTNTTYVVDNNGILTNGFVRVDKIFGSTKLDDKTVGFTWQESQYDYYTNKPNVQRIVDVVLKFAFDNTEYQNPQIYIDNQVSNIYISSNVFNTTTSNYILENQNTIKTYQSNISLLTSQLSPLVVQNSEILQSFSNYFTSNTLYVSVYRQMARLQPTLDTNTNLELNKIVISNINIATLYNNIYNTSNISFDNLSNFFITNNFESLPSRITTSVDFPNSINQVIQNTSPTSTTFDSSVRKYKNIYPRVTTIGSINGIYYYYLQLYTPPDTTPINTSIVKNYNLPNRFDILLNQYLNNSNIIRVKTQQIQEYTNAINSVQNVVSNINGKFKFTKFTNTQGNNFSIDDFRKYKNTIENLPSDLTNINYSNLAVKLFYELEEETLDDNDGACPANMVCGNPFIIKQLVDSYNFDSNNSDKILRVFKAFTPNAFRCDYSVEMANSNGTTKKGTIAFDVGQDITDCTYYVTSNHGFNSGYYIIDKVDYVQDTSGVDISGYSYVADSLYDYTKSVTNIFNPLIQSASNSVSSIINAVGISRLNTYEALGKINSLTINNCPVITYDTLTTLLNRSDFVDTIFKAYPYFEKYASKILRVGISGSNTIDVTYNIEELYYSGVSEKSYRLEGARFMIYTTPTYCDFYPVYMCNISPFPSREILNISNSPTYAYKNNISSDININNPFDYPFKVLNAQTTELSNLIVQVERSNYTTTNVPESVFHPAYTSYQGKIFEKILSYKQIDINKYIFSIGFINSPQAERYENIVSMLNSQGYSVFRSNETILYEIGKTTNPYYNQQYIKSKKILNSSEVSAYNANTMTSYRNRITSNCVIGAPTSPIYTSNNTYYFTNSALTDIKNKASIRDIYDYRIKPFSENSFEAELIIYSNINILPVNRTNIYISGYYDDCKLYITNSIIPSQTLFTYTPSNLNDVNIINVFRNYFNKTFKTTNSIYPELSKIYNGKINNDGTVTFGASIYYKLDSNIYDFNNVPNDIRFIGLKYFNVQFAKRFSEISVLRVNELTSIQSGLSNLNDTYPIIQSNFNYFMSNLSFKSFRLETIGEANTNYQVSQIELYHDGIFKYNINNIYPTNNFINLYTYKDGVSWDYNYNQQTGLWRHLPLFVDTNNNYLFNTDNVNNDNEDLIRVYEFNNTNINILLSSNIKLSGYSIVSGSDDSKCLNSWKLYGSIDNSNFFVLNSISNYQDELNYPNAFYRTPILSVFDNTSNIPLVQYPCYQKTLEQCGINPINSNIINNLLNLFPIEITSSGYNAEEDTSFNIKDIISYKVFGKKIRFLVNVFKFEDITSVTRNYFRDIIELTLRIRNDCSYTINYTNNINNVSIDFNDDGSTIYNYNSIPIPSDYISVSNDMYITNALYRHSIRGTYVECDSNFKSDLYNPLASLFEYIYYYGDDSEVPVLYTNFTTSNDIVPPLINNLSNINLESFNILYSKIRPLENYISYILSVNTVASNSVTVNTKFVYNIRSPYITDCTNITFTPIYDATSTQYLNLYGLVQFATQSNYLPYTSSNTFSNIKVLYAQNQFSRLLNCIPSPYSILNSYFSNYTPNTLFSNYTFNTTNAETFGIQFSIVYSNLNVTNNVFSFVMSNISLKQVYKYDNINYEGVIYYNDNISINTILDSNTPTYINFSNTTYLPISNVLEVKVQLNDAIMVELSNCSRRRNYTLDTMIQGSLTVNNLNLQDLSNYTQNETYTIIRGNTNINSVFNSNSYNTNLVKSNCQIGFTNTSNMLMKFDSNSYMITDMGAYANILNSDIPPTIAYGKTFSNDSLRYNYILKMNAVDTSEFYTEYSIKFYYGSLSNRVYKDKLYFVNSNYFCSYDYTIQLLNVIPSANITSYVSSNNYQNLLNYSESYMRILNNVRACSNILHPLSNTFMDSIYGTNGFSPLPPNGLTESPIYTKLLYYKNNLAELANNYVFSIHTSNNLVNPDYVEYRLNIEDIGSNCTNVNINRVRYRTLSYAEVLQLSNNNYVSYMDGINIEQNMSNCTINYDSLLDSDTFVGPSNAAFVDILREKNKWTEGDDPDNAINVLYKRYEKKLGSVIYSYLINVSNRRIVEYSLYFLHVSTDCTTSWGYYMNSSNITNVAIYASQNNYVSAVAALSQSQMMQIYNLNASNSTFINTINNKLSNLRTSLVYNNNLVSLRYVQSDYTNLINRYVIGIWPSNTPITLDSLINTQPQSIEYTITLSNIISSSNYTYSSTNTPTTFIGDINDYEVFLNNVFYKNGTRYNTTFYELSYSPYNCFTFYTASQLLQTVENLGIQSVVPSSEGESLNGIVAYKTNSTTRTYDYIAEIIQSGTFYYPVIKISLGTPEILNSCISYLDESAFSPSFVSLIPTSSLSSYITTNAFTSNANFIIGQEPQGFTNYEHFTTKKNIYSFIMFECENNFKIQEFKLYTFNDTEIPIEITNQTTTTLFIKNKNDHIIKGYSFITNSYSSSYDPKIWSIKATNDGRSWKTLDRQSLNNNIPRNYQMPIIYFNGTTKILPQPISKVSDKPKSETLDKDTLVKYYKQKINSSITPTFKKYMRNNDTYYCLFDAYDLNKNIVGSDLVVGFVMRDKSVKKAILYENDEGNYVPFDLKKKKMKEFWEHTIMLPLLFNTSF